MSLGRETGEVRGPSTVIDSWDTPMVESQNHPTPKRDGFAKLGPQN
jgi:hypothetical protein